MPEKRLRDSDCLKWSPLFALLITEVCVLRSQEDILPQIFVRHFYSTILPKHTTENRNLYFSRLKLNDRSNLFLLTQGWTRGTPWRKNSRPELVDTAHLKRHIAMPPSSQRLVCNLDITSEQLHFQWAFAILITTQKLSSKFYAPHCLFGSAL